MKKLHLSRKLIALLALGMAVAIAAGALAEGVLSTIYHAGTALLFDTNNATIKAHADFTYNGVHFKTFDGEYRQSGQDSHMDLTLKTPKSDGSIYEGGYVVIGNGDRAYSFDKEGVGSTYYQVNSCSDSEAILSSTIMRNTILNFGSALVAATEGAFADGITSAPMEDGSVKYQIQVESGDSPALLNTAGTLLAQLAAKKYYYVDYNHVPQATDDENRFRVAYADYEALEAYAYQQIFNEPMPANFYENMWGGSDKELSDTLYERYQQVRDYINALSDTLNTMYTHGMAVILADGATEYYEDPGDYYIAYDHALFHYEDYDSAVRAYYKKVTGTELSKEEQQAIQRSNNDALQKAYIDISNAMSNEYFALWEADGTHPALLVHADGTVEGISYSTFRALQKSDNMTVTSRILSHMCALELDTANAEVTMDAQGRITGMKGDVCIQVVDESGARNPLEITFDIACYDYGASVVETFDPKKYNLMSPEELAAYREGGGMMADLVSINDVDEKLPETVMFNGVSYQVTIKDSDGNG